MRKITMKRKSKTLNSDVPEEEKSEDGAGSSQEQDVEDSPSKKSKKSKRASKANEENGTDKKKKNDVSDEEEEDYAEDEPKKGKKNKRASKANEENGTDKKGKQAADDDEEEYEVEKVVGDKMVRGTRQYLIRWKGHGEDADTWEPESTLNCEELINEYLSTKSTKSSKSPKKGKAAKESPKKKSSSSQNDEESGEEVYEVDKIIDVYFKKNGQREFLVHWKGYSGNDNTWEPEDNMNCPELIERFMAKVEKAKAVETKELRVKRKPTDRFTVLMEQSGRKLSRRNLGKQRVHYFDTE